MDDIRYPIGGFNPDQELNDSQINALIDQIEALPGLLKSAVENLREDRLDSPYRPGGWTIRQLVHHLADSNMNAYLRVKLGLTEDKPTIKTFAEAKWAELADSRLPVAVSLNLLDGLHERWVAILRSLSPAEREREIIHPEAGQLTIKKMIALYAWHGNHHLAQITSSIKRMAEN